MLESASAGPILGVDLGGTKILCGVVDHSNRILSRAKRPTPAREGSDALMKALHGCALEAIEAAGLRPADLGGAGVGSPGPLDIERGYIVRSANLDVKDFPLGPGLSERLGMPVRVWGDVRAGGYGEFRLGAGQGFRDVVAVFVGTGIGGCIIIDGKIVSGSTGNAGEVGHIVIKTNGPRCGCGQRGCMEALASRTAIARRIGKAVARGQATLLASYFQGSKQERIKSKDLAAAYQSRDPVVTHEVGRAAHFLGLGLAGVINIIGPQVVVVGGGVVEALGEPYVSLVRTSARPHIVSDPQNKIQIVRAGLGDDSGILGASLLAREALSVKPAALAG
jgi:glucokinase